ncbi:hypothetical protein ABIA16_003535 [Sinorhizobium fredii]
MTNSDRLSPHYFVVWKQGNQPSPGDEEAAIRRAHRACRYLASLDLDHAQIANGSGFNKADSKVGHNVAKWPEQLVIRHFALAALAVRLAQKYERQLPPSLRVKPPAQQSMDV